MKIKGPVYKFILTLLHRLLIVNIIGFGFGALFNGKELADYLLTYFIYSSILGMTLWVGNLYFARFVDKRYSWLEYPVTTLILRFVFSLVYSTVVMVIFYMFIWFFVKHRPNLDHFFEANKFFFVIFYACTVLVMLIFHSISFFRSWQKAAWNEEKLKKESISLQLQALRNQVDPHFLFNSLNTLTSLIETDQGKAITFVRQLSEMFRYMLNRDSKEMIDIESELKFVEAYVFLQKMRFGDNLKVEINLSEKNFYILPISLQMLIENAIKHNEVSRDYPLSVLVKDEDDYLVVENKLQPKITETHSNGIGLKNLRTRYNFFTEKEVVLETLNEAFVVKIPKLRMA